MKDKRFLIGVIVTVIWISFSIYMLIDYKKPTELNSWGDFFAGFFSPLAFLWLVLGYLQQGDELRQSTEALKLQAQELKNSVEQQSHLVEVTRAQVQQEMDALEEERERIKDAARPKIIPQHSTITKSGNTVTYGLKLVNVGNTATKLRIKVDPPLEGFVKHNMAIYQKNEVIEKSFRRGIGRSIVDIDYIDANGFPGAARFTLEFLNDALEIGNVERIL